MFEMITVLLSEALRKMIVISYFLIVYIGPYIAPLFIAIYSTKRIKHLWVRILCGIIVYIVSFSLILFICAYVGVYNR